MANWTGDLNGVESAAPDYLAPDFDVVYRAELPIIVALLRALVSDAGTAEELAQEAFVRTYRHWGKVGGYERPGGFVRRVAVNLARSRHRRLLAEAKALARFGRPASVPAVDASTAEFWAAVQRLPRRQAEAVALRYVDDLSGAEIADAMGCDEATVRVHLFRARKALAAALELKVEP